MVTARLVSDNDYGVGVLGALVIVCGHIQDVVRSLDLCTVSEKTLTVITNVEVQFS